MRAAYDDVARCQLGLVLTSQLAERGWTHNEIQYAVGGDFERLRSGVLRCAGAPITREQAWLAAALAAGADHHLAHLTATAIWAYRGYPLPDAIDLVTESASRSRFDGVRTHRTLYLPPSHVTKRGPLPVTTPARTLIDTCGAVPYKVLRSNANDAIRRGLMRTVDFVRTFEQVPRSGRRKSRPAKLLIAEFVPGYDPGESDPELDIVDVLVGAGYPRPEQQIWVRERGWKYRIDVGYREVKHGFEFQSEQEHFNRASFHDDPVRTIRLQAAGWTIWPVTSRTARAEILLAAATAFGHIPGPFQGK